MEDCMLFCEESCLRRGIHVLLEDGQELIHLVGLQICLELIPVSIGEAVHDRVGTGGLDALVDIGKQVGDLLGVVRYLASSGQVTYTP